MFHVKHIRGADRKALPASGRRPLLNELPACVALARALRGASADICAPGRNSDWRKEI